MRYRAFFCSRLVWHRVHIRRSGVLVREQCMFVVWLVSTMDQFGCAARENIERILLHGTHTVPTTRVRVCDLAGRHICPVNDTETINKQQPPGSLPPHCTPESALRCSWGLVTKDVDGTYKINANFDERVDISGARFVYEGIMLKSEQPFGVLPKDAWVTAVWLSAAEAGHRQIEISEQVAGHEEESPPTTPETPPPPHERFIEE